MTFVQTRIMNCTQSIIVMNTSSPYMLLLICSWLPQVLPSFTPLLLPYVICNTSMPPPSTMKPSSLSHRFVDLLMTTPNASNINSSSSFSHFASSQHFDHKLNVFFTHNCWSIDAHHHHSSHKSYFCFKCMWSHWYSPTISLYDEHFFFRCYISCYVFFFFFGSKNPWWMTSELGQNVRVQIMLIRTTFYLD